MMLVVVSVAMFAAATIVGWMRGQTIANSVVLAAVNGAFAILLFVRPAVRSLHRWDSAVQP
jgi:hypothetical protein